MCRMYFRMNHIVCLFLLFDDYEDDFCSYLQAFPPKKRQKTDPIIESRDKEGVYTILIQKYLLSNEDKLKKYLRVTPHIFYLILDHIRDDISTKSWNRVQNPIDASQKLCLTLRCFIPFESVSALAN